MWERRIKLWLKLIVGVKNRDVVKKDSKTDSEGEEKDHKITFAHLER